MTRLNDQARETLAAHGITPRQWTDHHQPDGGPWGGDTCGCPDDRCTGHHHDAADRCGCLDVLIGDYLAARPEG